MVTRTLAEYPSRESLAYTKPELLITVPLTVKNVFKVAQGDVLGVIAASGLARRRSRSDAAEAHEVGVDFITVEDAGGFVAGDVLTLEDGTAVGTIGVGGVNEEDNELTLVAVTTIAIAEGDSILGSDGSQVAKGISDDVSDGVGDTVVATIISGPLKASLLRGLDASAVAELGGALMVGDVFKF